MKNKPASTTKPATAQGYITDEEALALVAQILPSTMQADPQNDAPAFALTKLVKRLVYLNDQGARETSGSVLQQALFPFTQSFGMAMDDFAKTGPKCNATASA